MVSNEVGASNTANTRASELLLGQLHEAVARDLLNRVASGEASAQELSAAIKFLKDNGIEAIVSPDSTMGQLASLPVFEDDDE